MSRTWYVCVAVLATVLFAPLASIVFVGVRSLNADPFFWLSIGAAALVVSAPVGLVLYFLRRSFWPAEPARTEDLASQLFILAITVASFYGFGWPDQVGHLREKFPEICVILVLFLLSELAAHLMRDARAIRKDLEVASAGAANAVQGAATDMTKAIQEASDRAMTSLGKSEELLAAVKNGFAASSEFLQTAKEVTKQLGSLNSISQALDPISAPDAREKLSEWLAAYAGSWSRQFVELEARHNKLECFKTICERYLREELAALGVQPGASAKSSSRRRVSLAMTEKLYFELLDAVVESLNKSSQGTAVYRAITNMLPEIWFNSARRRDGSKRALDHIANFRGRVAETICSSPHYERAILVSDNEEEAAGGGTIVSRSVLINQRDRFLLSLGIGPQLPSVGPHPAGQWKQLLQAVGTEAAQISEWIGNGDEQHKLYGIVPGEIAVRITNALDQEGWLQLPGHSIKRRVSKEPLIHYYIRTMHKPAQSAKVIVVDHSTDPYVNLPCPNPDWLVVGVKSGETYEWLMALTASLTPGSPTELVDIVVDDNELALLDSFWKNSEQHTLLEYLGVTEAEVLPAIGVSPGTDGR